MDMITLESMVSRKEEIVTADMDGETVMMSIGSGNYYNMGKMGSVIWDMIGEAARVETLILALLEKYEVTREQCEKEVLAFLNHMNKEGLLEAK